MNSDSRPGSVLDEQENTSDPPDTPMADAERKDSDTKVAEQSPTDESSTNATPKEDKPSTTVASSVDKSEPNPENKEKETSNEKPRTISGEESSNSVDEKSGDATIATGPNAKGNESPVPVSKAASSGTAAPTVTNTITSTTSSTVTPSISTSTITSSVVAPATVDLKPIEKIEGASDASFTPKNEQEMISTIANIKKESNAPAPVENINEYAGKKVTAMNIKKEPGQDESNENSSNSSSTTADRKDTNAEPSNEIKLANEIKTENKCGLDLTDTNSKHDDVSRSAFEPHIKFNAANKMPPIEAVHAKFNSDMIKPTEPIKFGQESALNVKYPPSMAADLSQKYDTKLFNEHPNNKFNENETKDKPANAEGTFQFEN